MSSLIIFLNMHETMMLHIEAEIKHRKSTCVLKRKLEQNVDWVVLVNKNSKIITIVMSRQCAILHRMFKK